MAKILLVEDDKSLREIYGVRLQAEGYTITSAGDGEEALAVAIKERPDLIVSDVMMPKISGFDMLDILRSTTETKDIKVIMMTALSSDDQRARGEALGADRYLVKSQVGIEDVVRTVHDVLGDGIAPAPVAAVTPVPVADPTPAMMPEPILAPQADPISAPMAAPIAAPIAAPTFIPEPVAAPTPVADPVMMATPALVSPMPMQESVAPPVEQGLPPTIDLPVPQFVPTSAPISELVAPVSPVELAPQPLAPAPPTAYEASAYAPPAAYAPAEPFPVPVSSPPATTVFPAPQPLQAPTPGISLPQPTAPFSSNPPASLGDRIINPLPSADGLGGGITDIASQMNQELNAHLQALEQPAAAPAPQPAQYAMPPQPPIPPLPPQPGL